MVEHDAKPAFSYRRWSALVWGWSVSLWSTINGWLSRISADVRRSNQWLDPAWKPRRRRSTQLVVFTYTGTNGTTVRL